MMQVKFSNVTAAEAVLDQRPDAALRWEINLSHAIFRSWLEGKLNETVKVGKYETRAKYSLDQLLSDPDPAMMLFDVAGTLHDGFADEPMTPGGIILPSKYRVPHERIRRWAGQAPSPDGTD